MHRQKLFAFSALAALLLTGFVATSLISYLVAHDSLTDRIEQETLPLTSDNIYSEIERDLLRSTLISSLMAHDTFVRDWTLGGEQQPQRIIRYLQEIQAKYDTTTAFFVSERSRRYYHPRGVLKTVDPEAAEDAWYFRVRELREPYEINVDHDTADRSRLSIFVNYRLQDYDGDYLGAIGIGLAVNRVRGMIEAYQQRYGRQIYFIDRQGAVTLRGSGFSGAERIQQRPGLQRLATNMLANPSTALSYETEDGGTTYVNTRLIPEFDWYLVVEQTESAAESRILNTLLLNLALALALTLLVLALVWFAFRGYQRRLEQMATVDPATGAATRPMLELLFERTAKSARRRATAVSLMTLDIDRFKAINDGYGHDGGDVVLREFAAIVRRCIREADTLCRWGGDEFVVVLSDCALDDARALAEKVRAAVEAQPVRFGREAIAVTVSVGVAEQRPGEDLQTLMKRADAALYSSKSGGRNRMSVA